MPIERPGGPNRETTAGRLPQDRSGPPRRYHRSVPTLAELEATVLGCTLCPLAEGRTKVVFGVGDPNAELLFVGEAPGKDEDLQGEPFVGRSGKLLDRLVLEEMGLTRDQFFIANVLKCLRYNAQVQLGDGTWERIGRLVASRYSGQVMAVDESGRLVPKQVIGWHATPLAGRRVFKLSYRSAKRTGASGTVSIDLTEDHPVLTERGYVDAGSLTSGTRIATGQGLSAVARDVVCGTLLGDGSLNRHSAYLSFSHSASQRAYAGFKSDLLAELGVRVSDLRVAAVAGDEHRYDVVQVRTLAHRALGILRKDFYDTVKQVPEWLVDALTPRMLAFWFMDDGYTRIRPPRQPRAEIATCAFSDQDRERLVRALARLGVRARAQRTRLHFDVVETRKLSELIAPYIPASMRYKLHPEVASLIPFDPRLFEPGPQEVMYDEVRVVDVTDRPRADSTFYCIDVEDTHNFVTSGGVVHNCRPPGNRDPKPDEIASCRPYLEQQIELITPRVIVTLGNFATKLLLDTTDGITKVRGRTYAYGDTALVPTFHPSAALQGGGGDVLAKMRADLVRAKQILAGAPVS